MSVVRLRRLQADFQKVQEYVNRHPRVELIQTDGNPPERYQLRYQIRSLQMKGDRLLEVDTHMVEITLPLNYPRVPPQCRMLTPIFHPNIAPHAICIGDHWSAGEPLPALVARIGELIAYQSYNTKSPLNGEAARWTSQNLDQLPLDAVCMLPEETAPAQTAPTRTAPARTAPIKTPEPPAIATPPPSVSADESLVFSCPECNTRVKLPAKLKGKRVRCPRCKAIFKAPGDNDET